MTEYNRFFQKLEDDGLLVNDIVSLGWAFWPQPGGGYMDEHVLRKLADEIEKRNKPFWDEYEAHCRAQPVDLDNMDFIGEFDVQTASAVPE